MMKLYHGTNVPFAELDPSRSREGLDFGTGAYLTPDIGQAWGMARRKQMVLGGRRLVMEFEFDESCVQEKRFAASLFSYDRRGKEVFEIHYNI